MRFEIGLGEVAPDLSGGNTLYDPPFDGRVGQGGSGPMGDRNIIFLGFLTRHLQNEGQLDVGAFARITRAWGVLQRRPDGRAQRARLVRCDRQVAVLVSGRLTPANFSFTWGRQ